MREWLCRIFGDIENMSKTEYHWNPQILVLDI
jgi:hypothetical protein